jgi:hypothetical protein
MRYRLRSILEFGRAGNIGAAATGRTGRDCGVRCG